MGLSKSLAIPACYTLGQALRQIQAVGAHGNGRALALGMEVGVDVGVLGGYGRHQEHLLQGTTEDFCGK